MQTCGFQARLFGKDPKELFWDFHRANPEVYTLLLRKARQARAKGKTKYSMRAIWEVVRWDLNVTSTDVNQNAFKLNDHYVPHYARLIMDQNPEFEGFFELRRPSTPRRPRSWTEEAVA